jgi:predicted nuclease of restriction endonuclease-like (RecB) superfamily
VSADEHDDAPDALMVVPAGYAEWLADVKARVHAAQQRAALAVNAEVMQLYWRLGRDILEQQGREGWGAKVTDRLAHDLKAAFPEVKGFSPRNLKYMRRFAEAWPDQEFVQQLLHKLPWFHLCTLLDKLKDPVQRDWYLRASIQYGWSRSVLVMQIETNAHKRLGQALTNFELQLPKPQSDLARESLKDPYRFDFLSLGAEAHEREIETALVQHITQFLLELGAGFAFVGRQVHLEVGGEDFYIDLLFYHLKLRAYVVIELKATNFKPEHTGQLGFYLSAVDAQVKAPEDAPTIGLLLCKSKNRIVAEYALRDMNKPMGIAEYQLAEALPKDLEANLPSIEQIERELGDTGE